MYSQLIINTVLLHHRADVMREQGTKRGRGPPRLPPSWNLCIILSPPNQAYDAIFLKLSLAQGSCV